MYQLAGRDLQALLLRLRRRRSWILRAPCAREYQLMANVVLQLNVGILRVQQGCNDSECSLSRRSVVACQRCD